MALLVPQVPIYAAEEPVTFSTLEEAANAGVVASVPENSSNYVEGEVLVLLADEQPQQAELASAEEAIAELSAVVEADDVEAELMTAKIDGAAMAVLELPEDVNVEEALLQLANDESIAYAQPNYIYTPLEEPTAAFDYGLSYVPNDPYASDPSSVEYQWWLGAVDLFNAWDKQRVNGAVTVAVIDTGARLDHDDLNDNILQNLAWDAVYNKPLAQQVAEGKRIRGGDWFGHGTHVSGIIAAETNNGLFGAGASYNAKLLPVSVCEDYMMGATTDQMISGYNYVLEKRVQANVKVMNISMGGPMYDTLSHQKLVEVTNAGILVVVAAGNSSDNTPQYPSDFAEVVSVTSVGMTLEHSAFSSYGPGKNIAAPGENIGSLWNGSNSGDKYNRAKGTSMATPVVAGVAALLFAQDPSRTPEQVKQILYGTATDLGTPGWDQYYGWGLVNANAALGGSTVVNHTVTFNPTGGTVSPTSIIKSSGSAIGTLPVPVRVGYSFNGWYTAATGGTQISATTLVTANVTYYAQWTATGTGTPGGLDGATVSIASVLVPSRVLGIAGQSTATGARLVVQDNAEQTSQRFTLKADAQGYYTLTNVASGLALDVYDARATNGAALIQWTSHGGDNQKWQLTQNTNGSYTISSKLNVGFCIDLPASATAVGTQAALWTKGVGQANQQFFLNVVSEGGNGGGGGDEGGDGGNGGELPNGVYTIASASTQALVLGIKDSSRADGAIALLQPSNSSLSQRFVFTRDAQTGYYSIVNVASSKALDVNGASKAEGAAVIQWTHHGNLNQLWRVVPVADGSYAIYSAASGWALDASKGATSGAPIVMWNYHGAANQRWVLKS